MNDENYKNKMQELNVENAIKQGKVLDIQFEGIKALIDFIDFLKTNNVKEIRIENDSTGDKNELD